MHYHSLFTINHPPLKTIKYLPNIIVSKVDNTEGLSSESDNLDKMRAEDDLSLKNNIPFWYYLIKIPKGVYRTILSMKHS